MQRCINHFTPSTGSFPSRYFCRAGGVSERLGRGGGGKWPRRAHPTLALHSYPCSSRDQKRGDHAVSVRPSFARPAAQCKEIISTERQAPDLVNYFCCCSPLLPCQKYSRITQPLAHILAEPCKEYKQKSWAIARTNFTKQRTFLFSDLCVLP